MKRIIITAIVAFSIGSLSLLTNQCDECAPTITKSGLVVLHDQTFLATAD